ncbi:MAG: hypothetical protein ACRDLQ_09995 [Solirubrobacterales bacterium]
MAVSWPTFRPDHVPKHEWMLITRYFVLIHIPRTGGNFIRDVCFAHLPRNWLIRNALNLHTPYEEIADDFSDLPMLCFVRNPWDWYVSWYHHQTQHYREERSGPMWVSAFDRGRNDFRQTVVNCCVGENYENPATKPIMQKLDVDHHTARFIQLTGSGIESGHIEVGKYERLREDFLDYLERHDVPVSRAFAERVSTEPPKHTTKRAPYREYYDDELRDLVAQKARLMIDRYGYEF